MVKKNILTILTFVAITTAENVGWKSYFVENPTEFHDIPLIWESGNETNVPSWLSGIYVRNGPAQLTFGSPKRHLSSWLDGFAKLHSFKFDGKNVYFSGKMLESTTYMDSVAKGELVPQLTLNPLANPDEEWTLMEVGEILYKQVKQWLNVGDLKHNGYDNDNPGLWRLGSVEDPIYIAATDFPYPQRFDINTLDTLELLRPTNGFGLTGCTHYQREPNTDNSINFAFMHDVIFGNDLVSVYRYTPENRDYANPEIVATFKPHKNSAVHSFAITESYAIFFYPGMTYDMSLGCVVGNHFHVLECMEYLGDEEPTDVYIVNLKNGEIQEIQVDAYFFQHHINAFELENGREIIVDLSPADPWSLRDYVKLENMLNPPEFGNGSTASGNGELTRYHFYLDTGSVVATGFPTLLTGDTSRYIKQFDFPTINEAYRGKEYCIIYGWSAFDYSRTAMVKKNTCDPTGDRVIYMENHYTSEMSFIANPEAKTEDDGVLVTIVFDGEKEQSYLLILDALTFTIIDKAYLPHNIPWSAHGMHFPEAKWTLNHQ